MLRATTLADLAARRVRVSLAVGFFDGVHRGHQRVLRAAVARARALGGEAWALTFEPHPLAVLNPAHAPALLTPSAMRDALLEKTGIDGIVVLPFSSEFAALSPEEFVRRHLLQGDWAPEVVFAGEDWRFGAGGAGRLADLPALSDGRIRVRVIPELLDGGSPVSSTRIRAALADGDMVLAARLLGRPYCLSGKVERGRGVGRSLDAATANLAVPPGTAIPKPGVYAAFARCPLQNEGDKPQTGNGKRKTRADFIAVVNIGVRPTFHDAESGKQTIEAHIIGFSGDLYGKDLELDFYACLRDERAFDSPEALAAQIKRDIKEAEDIAYGRNKSKQTPDGISTEKLRECLRAVGDARNTPPGASRHPPLGGGQNKWKAPLREGGGPRGAGGSIPCITQAEDSAGGSTPSAARVLQSGRNLTLLVPGAAPDGGDLVVKRFGKPSCLRRMLDRLTGKPGKAERSYAAAAYLTGRGIGTPEPLGMLPVGDPAAPGGALATRAVPGLRSFHRELADLYAAHGPCSVLMERLQTIAEFCADMHDAGFLHRDLGDQNLFFAGDPAEGRVMTLDLNRGRCLGRPLTLRERARDLSRIDLPSDLLRVFLEMYWRGDVPPRAFLRLERRYRREFQFHCATRRFRHPIRERRKPPNPEGEFPAPCDYWIWDGRSVQAISAFRSRDRHRHQQSGRVWKTLAAIVSFVLFRGLRGRFRRFRASAFRTPVEDVGSRLAIALSATPDTLEREIALLRELAENPKTRNSENPKTRQPETVNRQPETVNRQPETENREPIRVLLRLYAHEPPESQSFTLAAAKRLHEEGFGVALALVQCRESVTDPASWDALGRRALDDVRGFVRWVEVGHAVNRVKWGLWGYRDLHALLAPVAGWRRDYPEVRFVGPSVIDFEPDFTMAALREGGATFDALSQHLYVDRRGAPEREQNGFDSVDKLALLRAVCEASNRVRDGGLVVSEFNWPLLGQGVWSPVGSPYESPGVRHGDPSVTEEQAAAYTLRFTLLGICSGLASEMVFWRLVARGFGLVDDTDPAAWRRRLAFEAVRMWFRHLSGARFERREDAPDGRIRLLFTMADGHALSVSWNPATDEMPAFQPGERCP